RRSRNPYSAGTGASPLRYITASFPLARRPSVSPSCEPSASPSGFSCVTTRKRSSARSVSATACRSLVVVVIWLPHRRQFGGQLVDQLRHPNASLDRLVVFEGEMRGTPQRELAVDPRL